MSERRSEKRDFPGKRWLIVGLRTVHTLALIDFAIALHIGGAAPVSGGLLLFSGLAMFAIDLWAQPGHLRQLAGFGIAVKLLLLGLALLKPDWALAIFWAVVAGSAVLAHAPGHFRHYRVF